MPWRTPRGRERQLPPGEVAQGGEPFRPGDDLWAGHPPRFRAPLGKEEHRLPGLSAVRPYGMNEACMGMPLNFPYLGIWTQD